MHLRQWEVRGRLQVHRRTFFRKLFTARAGWGWLRFAPSTQPMPWAVRPRGASALSGFGFHLGEDFDGLVGLGEGFATLRIATAIDVLADALDDLGDDFGVGGLGGGVHMCCLVQLGLC